MKYLKMLMVIAVASAAFCAVLSGSASATVLCKKAISPCPEDYPAGTVGTASLLGSAAIRTTEGTTLVTCNETTITGTSENTGGKGEAVKSIGGEWLVRECTNPVTVLKTGKLSVFHISGTHNGTVIAEGAELTVGGIFGASCVYGPGSGLDLGTYVGGTGELNIKTVVNRVSGGFTCPSDVWWTASYRSTSPATPVYIEEE